MSENSLSQSSPQHTKDSWLCSDSKRLPIFLVRHKDGVNVYTGGADLPHFSLEDQVFQSLWSPDGEHLLINSSLNGLVIYKHPLWNGGESPSRISSFKLLKLSNSPQFPARSLRHLQWSPKGTLVVAHWQYDSKASQAGLDERNVLVWKISFNGIDHVGKGEGDAINLVPVAAFSLKGTAMGQWPILKWRNDEKFCLLSSRSEVLIFDGLDIGNVPIMRIPLSGVISTEPAPVFKSDAVNRSTSVRINCGDSGNKREECGTETLTFAAFSPASSTTEGDAIFRIVVVPEVRRKGTTVHEWHVTVQKPLASSDAADVSWSPSGTTVLIVANTTVDAAGENYGGVGDVYLARFDGSLTVKVNKAVAQEACWSPCRDEFIVIEGKSPSEMFLYDQYCNVLYEFPVAYRNTIRWDCFGRMVALGGFGNLAGDLTFWYRDSESRGMRAIADWREPCTVLCGWSPDGRHFHTASTYPRMKVDNQFKVFSYEGYLLTSMTFSQLLDVQWKPEMVGAYSIPSPPIPQSSAITATKKFQMAKDLVNDTKNETKRFITSRNSRKDAVSFTGNNTTSSTSTLPTGKSAALLSSGPTAAQAAKLERSRQLDSISDWRASPKEPLRELDSVATTIETVGAPSRRRGSATRPKFGERNTKLTTTSDASSSSVPNSEGEEGAVKTQDTQGQAVVCCAVESTKPSSVSPSPLPRAGVSQPITGMVPSGNILQQSGLLSNKSRDAMIPSVETSGHRIPQSISTANPKPTVPMDRMTAMAWQQSSEGEQPASQINRDQVVASGTLNVSSGEVLLKNDPTDTLLRSSVQRNRVKTSGAPLEPSIQPTSRVQYLPEQSPYVRQHPSRTNVQEQQPSSNSLPDLSSSGLVTLLKSILPPDAAVHVSRESQARPVIATNSCESDCCSLSDHQHSRFPSVSNKQRGPPPSVAQQVFLPQQQIQNVSPATPPPTSGNFPPVDRLDSLVNLLVRSQQDKTSGTPELPTYSAESYNESKSQYLYRPESKVSSTLLGNQSSKHFPIDSHVSYYDVPPQYDSTLPLHQQQNRSQYMPRNLPMHAFPQIQNNVSEPHSTNQTLRQLHQTPAVHPSQQSTATLETELLLELQNKLKNTRGHPKQRADMVDSLLLLQQQLPLDAVQHLDMNNNHPAFEGVRVQRAQQLMPASRQSQQQMLTLDPGKDRCWEYLDPRGKIQGPFSISDMQKLHLLGYFEPSLPIRYIPGGNFTPLCQLFPPGTEPFKLL